jgi:hypothetical protein
MISPQKTSMNSIPKPPKPQPMWPPGLIIAFLLA